MNDYERVERKLNVLLNLLDVMVEKCDHPNCAGGVDVTSYSDEFACERCGGLGEIFMKGNLRLEPL